MKFRKKPVVIEARQLSGTTADQHGVYCWIEANTLGSFEPLDVIEGRKPYPESGVSIDPRDGRLIISTLEGLHWADLGDWIIRGVKGEFYPCKSDIFEATYEAVAELACQEGRMSEPSREHVEAVACQFHEFRCDGGRQCNGVTRYDVGAAETILTSTDPAVLDAMQDALVRAGRLRGDEQWCVRGMDGYGLCPHRSAQAAEDCATEGDAITYERRFVTEWHELEAELTQPAAQPERSQTEQRLNVAPA